MSIAVTYVCVCPFIHLPLRTHIRIAPCGLGLGLGMVAGYKKWPRNMMVTGDVVDLESRVKLIDFGVAKCLHHGPLETVVGTPPGPTGHLLGAKAT